MIAQRPLSWFLTDTGRKFSFTALTAFGIGATAFKFGPNTVFLYKYKEIIHYYRDGKPAELPSELQNRVKKCLELLKMPEQHQKLIQPFSVFGFDLFHAGSIKSKYGAAIGIPVNFTYKSMADIDKEGIKVSQKSVDWNSETGKKLSEALLLTEEEQEFALCREILSTNNSKLFLQSAYPCSCVLMAYMLSQNINRRMNLYVGPVGLRVVIYSLISLFTVGLYFFLHDYTEVFYETAVDQDLCEIDPKFIETGVSFYDKMLKRNQALRELMGAEGANLYSVKGNENFLLRQPRIALVHRKQFFEHKLAESKGLSEYSLD